MSEILTGGKINPGIQGRSGFDCRWRKMRRQKDTEALLRKRELWYTAACDRLARRHPSADKVWNLHNRQNEIIGLLLYSRRNLLPVFCDQKKIPAPYFLNGILGVLPINSIQGLRNEAEILEDYLERFQRNAVEKIDYDLMCLDRFPDEGNFSAGPAGLILRAPRFTDMDALAALQAGYEQEEVLPKGSVFNPTASRLNMERIFSNEQLLTAEIGGRLVGKINTSAVCFTRFQIGGVYVHPDFRGRGIARRMAVEFVRSLVAQGRGVNLFVKKSNTAALSVYRRLGFNFLADYRISYY